MGRGWRDVAVRKLREHGIDPTTVDLSLGPDGPSLTVYFDADGQVNGTGTVGVARPQAPQSH
ncbi:MAG TPA: hypothetical protein DCK98_14250 [Chloroflexi bacterium]|jgi:hypothetical protein|nr:hypothetical protein [Chloroflexota bacterium]HAL28771.1 hypothetical protein [Chloroflexota bacterium]